MKLISMLPAMIMALQLTACMTPPKELDLSPSRVSSQAKYQITLRPSAEPLALNRIHSWDVEVLAPGGERVTDATIAVDGGMPQHGHGLPTRPRVTGLTPDGHYLIEGMKFSMSGWWEITLSIDSPEWGPDVVTFNRVLPPVSSKHASS